MRVDSLEFIGVVWDATVPLGGQAVSIGLRSPAMPEEFFTASWAGSASTTYEQVEDGETVIWFRRTARVLIGPGGSPSVGEFASGTYTVSSWLPDNPEIPKKDAYKLRLTEVS